MNYLKHALRNTRRHTRRSILTGLAVGIAVMTVTFYDAYIHGALNAFFDAYVRLEAGHIKLMPQAAVDRSRPLPLDECLQDVERILSIADTTAGIAGTAPRVKFPVLLDKPGGSIPALGMAVIPSREQGMLNLENLTVEGRPPADDGWEILLGEGLAQELGLGVGDELFMVTADAYGGLGPGLYTVVGLSRSGVSTMDNKIFYVPLSAVQEQLNMPDAATEIVCRIQDGMDAAPEVAQRLQQNLTAAGIVDVAAVPWQEQGELYAMFSNARWVYLVVMALLGVIALTTVVNTILMSVLERTREIGALRALGFMRRDILSLIVSESFILGLGGTIGGFIAGYALGMIFNHVGIDLSAGLKNIDLPIMPIIYPEPRLLMGIKASVFGVLVSVLAAWYPARVAGRLQPAEALRGF